MTGAAKWADKSLELISRARERRLLDNSDESFYVVNLDDICDKYTRWFSLLPNVHPFYAVKCNTDPVLLKLLAFLGLGFDCASKNEMELVLKKLGVSPDRIVYANPCKQRSHLSFASKNAVSRMTFDCVEELHKIKRYHSDPELIVRIATEDSGAACQLSNKFGTSVSIAKSLIRTAAIELGMRVVGVSFHVGSGQTDPNAFRKPIKDARELFIYARNELGIETMNLLDIGGGYPGTNNDDLFFQQAQVVANALKEEGFSDDESVKIISEPGRYFAASAFTLATPVISSKKESDSVAYYVSESVYGSFNCLFYDHSILSAPSVLFDPSRKRSFWKQSTVWGSTCDGLDKIMENALLPELIPGEDWLIWHDMGAYTISGSVNFNGLTMGKPLIYHSSKQTWLFIEKAFKNDCNNGGFEFVVSDENTVQPITTLPANDLKFLLEDEPVTAFPLIEQTTII